MKKLLALTVIAGTALTACSGETETTYAGTYHGVSNKSEVKDGDTSTQRTEVVMALDADGLITEFEINFFNSTDQLRNSASISTTYIGAPSANTTAFDLTSNDDMSVTMAHHDGGVYTVAMISPYTRVMFEATGSATDTVDTLEWTTNLDHYSSMKGGATDANRANVWTSETSDGAFDTETMLRHPFLESYGVTTKKGIFKDMTIATTIEDLFTAVGGVEGTTDTVAEFHSNGGWLGNYTDIEAFMIGKDATTTTTLWTEAQATAGATDKKQDSTAAIAGATVRVTRENHAYQLALVEAGILTTDDVHAPVKW